MAKRNKADEEPVEEDYEFIPPEFDEDQFIHKEMVSFHTTVVLFLAGIAAAVASWAAFAALDGARLGWFLGLVIVIVAFAFLRPLFRLLNIDISHWARREWIGTAFLTFFTWLAFFIMLVNPPISDFADPVANLYVGPSAATAGEPVVLDLFLHDNAGLDGHESVLTAPDGSIVPLSFDLVDSAHHHYQATAQLGVGAYTWTVTVTDENGRSQTSEETFTVAPAALTVTIDASALFPIQVQTTVPEDNIWAVYAEIAGGDRVFLELDEKVGAWVATPNFKGWKAGQNNFTITVEELNRFDGQSRVDGAKLTAGPYTLTVDAPGDYDDSVPKKANPTEAKGVNIPGLEAPLLLAGLLAVAFMVRRRS